MSEPKYTPDQNLDEKLANMVDQVLAGESGDLEMSSQEIEMQKLKDMVLLLHHAASDPQLPPEEMQSRIRSRLVETWKDSFAESNKNSVLQNLRAWFEVHQRQLVYSGATLVILLVVFAFVPGLASSSLSGTAGLPPDEQPVPILTYGLLVPIAFAAAAVMWFLTRPKE